jgi:mRNA interferase MazF
MKRGDLVKLTIDYARPYPAMVLQADAFDQHRSVVVLPLTHEIHDTPLFRISVPANEQTGLTQMAQIMVDKPTTIARSKLGYRTGQIDAHTLHAVEEALRGFLGL